MLLAVDIGNSETTLGAFEGDQVRADWHLATAIHRTADEYAALLLDLLDSPPEPSDKLKSAVAAYKQSSLHAED